MRKMEEKKGKIVRHIQSARQWLERAEHAVNSESSARGELDLILAKAEVQLAQEKRSCAAELPAKIMAYVLRPKSILTIALGGVAASMLFIPYLWMHFSQDVNMPVVHSFQTKIQLEAPAIPALYAPSEITMPHYDSLGNSQIPQGEQKEASKSPAPLLPVTKGHTVVAQSTAEPVDAVQSPKTSVQTTSAQPMSVSEQEIRMLMRTAERVLKSTN